MNQSLMEKERLGAFMDVVLAIIMTILVLELEKPTQMTMEGFWELRTNFFAYSLSFFWLGAMWINQHANYHQVKYVNTKTVWAAMLMLFFSSLFPYATSLVAEHFNNGFIQSFYGGIVLAITLSNILYYRYLAKANVDKYEQLMTERWPWLKYDILIKLVGLGLSLTIFPPAVCFSILITLGTLVIPRQLR